VNPPPHDPLLAAHHDALEQVAALTLTRADIVGASEGANADDEHDPEGTTIAYERQQVAALLEQAEASLAAAEAALAARESGRYGVCDRCGTDIGAERLEARPSATTCIDCARRFAGRP
jgi:RNA polymerase-binding transcription factor DksA